jgi:hypothetical protein
MSDIENRKRFIELSQIMADHTVGECGDCARPHSCCSRIYCDAATRYAKKNWGIILKPTGNPDVPFLGKNGCTVPPHLRPLCTVHTCEVASRGIKEGDPDWTERYFELREEMNETMPFS